MINLPVTIWLNSSYEMYYDECWWFLGWHCTEKSKSGFSETEHSTMYFDVLPENVDRFVKWRALESMDRDHDGLRNSTREIEQ